MNFPYFLKGRSSQSSKTCQLPLWCLSTTIVFHLHSVIYLDARQLWIEDDFAGLQQDVVRPVENIEQEESGWESDAANAVQVSSLAYVGDRQLVESILRRLWKV